MRNILPPTLFLLTNILMFVLFLLFDFTKYISYPHNLILGLPLLVLGLSISFYNSNIFKKNKINIMTFDKPSHLYKQGMYKYSRNPMYLGFAIAIFAMSILFQFSLIFIFLSVCFFLITNYIYIKLEEKYMFEEFGNEYTQYCKEVRRWI